MVILYSLWNKLRATVAKVDKKEAKKILEEIVKEKVPLARPMGEKYMVEVPFSLTAYRAYIVEGKLRKIIKLIEYFDPMEVPNVQNPDIKNYMNSDVRGVICVNYSRRPPLAGYRIILPNGDELYWLGDERFKNVLEEFI